MGKRFDQSWEPILAPLLNQPYMAELSFLYNNREIRDLFSRLQNWFLMHLN